MKRGINMIFDTLKNVDNYKGLGRVYTALKFLSETDFTLRAI